MTPSPSVEEGVTGWGWRNQAPPSTGGVPSLPAQKGVTGSGMVARCLRAALRGMLDPSDPRYVPPELHMQCVMKFKEKRKGHTVRRTRHHAGRLCRRRLPMPPNE